MTRPSFRDHHHQQRRRPSWALARHHARRLRRPLGRYVGKFAGSTTAAPPPPALVHVLASWVGALIAIGVIGWLAQASHAPLMMASFGASCVLLFGYPDSHFSQPRNTVGGHLLAATVGVACAHLAGDASGVGWPLMALAVATAIAGMKLTRTVHPPAGSTAIISAQLHHDWSFLLLPVGIGAVLLVALAAVYNNVIEHRRYPLYWR
jgi:CBS-domain-containing membrane protein